MPQITPTNYTTVSLLATDVIPLSRAPYSSGTFLIVTPIGITTFVANNINLGVANGGTGATTAINACTNLGLLGKQVVGTENNFLPTNASPALINYDVAPVNANNSRYFSFSPSVVTSIFTQITLPKNITKSSFTYQLICEASNTNVNSAQFSAKGVLHINGTSYDIAYGTATTLSVSMPGTANQQVTSSESSAVVPANIGSLPDVAKLDILISRNGNVDSYTGSVKVKGIFIYMSQNQGNQV